jgi:hypothetical protein
MFPSKIIVTILFLIVLGHQSMAQPRRLSGYVTDRAGGERLIGATVFDTLSRTGVVTNEYGFFTMSVNGPFACRVSYVGYEPRVVSGTLTIDTLMTVRLNQGIELGEITISSKSRQEDRAGLSAMQLNPEMIKSIPAFFGERDVLKAIQIQPGVSPNKEGTSGFSVRGGSHDQNLFLLDGIPVYNVNHLFGFFSVFSPQAINSCTFLKGGMPARYGGRLSSLVDMRLKEGNNEKLHGHVTAGIIASGMSLEGPLVKDRSTFFVTARRTYIDVFSRPISRMINREEAAYYFQDFTLKTNYTIDQKNKLYLSFYGGNDKASLYYNDKDETGTYKSNFSLGWGNIISALRWNSVWGKSVFSNATLYFSRYNYQTSYLSENKQIKPEKLDSKWYTAYNSNVRDWGFKWDTDIHATNKLKFRTGTEAILHRYRPGVSELIDKDKDNKLHETQGMVIDNIELSVYAEADYSPLRFLNFNLGLRASHALMAGVERPILQPRLSAKAFLSENFSLLASYNRHAQFVHLVSNSNIGAPSDLWLPIMEGIPPQEAEQYTFGGAYTISKGFQFSAEAYYKDFNNLLEFRPDEIINHNVTNWAEVTLLGTGTSKGVELLLEKTTGKTTGWLAYTLSKTDRTFEGINDGKTFPFKYDRTHNISIMAAHQLSANKQLSVTWVYTSGYYITLQFDNYFLPLPDQTMCIANYRVKNNFRTPAYHRLDLSYSVKKQKKKGVREWSYGLYNAYSRVNPFMIVYDDVLEEKRDENGHLDGYKVIDRRLIMMGLFPIIPSVSYTYTF